MLIREAVLAAALALGSAGASAETFVAGHVGVAFGQELSNIKGSENVAYPNLPGPGELLPGARVSNLDLDTGVLLGTRIGHYFEAMPTLGFEGEVRYWQPNIQRQNSRLTNSNPGFSAIFGQDSITEDQQRVNARLLVLGLNVLARYEPTAGLTGYVGFGPTVNILKITGSGLSGVILDPPAFVSPGGVGPKIDDVVSSIGFSAKAGLEYRVTDKLGVGVQYQYSWIPFEVSRFRSIHEGSGEIHSNALTLFVAHYF